MDVKVRSVCTNILRGRIREDREAFGQTNPLNQNQKHQATKPGEKSCSEISEVFNTWGCFRRKE